MTRFVDEYLPRTVPGFPCLASPRFKTSIQQSWGGGENANQEWEHPLHRYTLPEAIARKWEVVNALSDHFKIMRGPAKTFPFYDPFDFASCPLVKPNLLPSISMLNQPLGVVDGFTDRFKLKKRYTVGAETYDRPIKLPVVASVLVARDGVLVPAADYTVSRPGGEVLFDVPPALGGAGILTAGFLFDVNVRYESDDALDQILRATKVAGFADLTLVEVPLC